LSSFLAINITDALSALVPISLGTIINNHYSRRPRLLYAKIRG
jgi:hypothetical protein